MVKTLEPFTQEPEVALVSDVDREQEPPQIVETGSRTEPEQCNEHQHNARRQD